MKQSKKIFLGLSGLFFLVMIIIGFDISRRTTFPGSKKLLPQSIQSADTTQSDTVRFKNDRTNIEAKEE